MKGIPGFFVGVLLLVVSNIGLTSERMDDGKQAYDEACARCHDTGVMNAPITGRQQDWQGRSSLWEAVAVEHADKGYLTMPAKGGDSRQTQYSVGAAAEYMLNRSYPARPGD
ncbi:MAG: c-type cytochrome [Halieaceae bacterium]